MKHIHIQPYSWGYQVIVPCFIYWAELTHVRLTFGDQVVHILHSLSLLGHVLSLGWTHLTNGLFNYLQRLFPSLKWYFLEKIGWATMLNYDQKLNSILIIDNISTYDLCIYWYSGVYCKYCLIFSRKNALLSCQVSLTHLVSSSVGSEERNSSLTPLASSLYLSKSFAISSTLCNICKQLCHAVNFEFTGWQCIQTRGQQA